MNATEQRTHRTVTQDLARQVEKQGEDLALVIEAIDERVTSLATSTVQAIEAEQTLRVRLAAQQRDYVDSADFALRCRIDELRARGFWGRMNWVFTGR